MFIFCSTAFLILNFLKLDVLKGQIQRFKIKVFLISEVFHFSMLLRPDDENFQWHSNFK